MSVIFKEFKELFRNYVKFYQMGLLLDIVLIVNMLVKVVFLELCCGENIVFIFLEEDLDGLFYMWVNCRELEFFWYFEDSFYWFNEFVVLRWY